MDSTACQTTHPSWLNGFVVPHSSAQDPLTVNAILRAHAPAICAAEPRQLAPYKAAVLERLILCRQPELGSHAWHCDWCGNTQITYNGCHNRHCAGCHKQKRMMWVDRILSWALPIEYLHCVFTLPHEFIPLFLANDRDMYRLFFQSVSDTLQNVARDTYDVRIGIVMVLHTWGQRMNLHVHIHVLVTCGGLSFDETAWVPITASNDAFAEAALACQFRTLFLDGLRKLFRQQKLTMPASMASVMDEPALDRWLAPVLRKDWRVNVQEAPPHCEGPDAVVKYLAGYVVGSAIRDDRILRHDGRCVVIRIKNYRNGRIEEWPMTGEDFVRRFACHILPRHFLRVRYAGLFSPSVRTKRLTVCRTVLESTRRPCEIEIPRRNVDTPEPTPEPEPYAPECRRCGMSGMVSRGSHTYWQTIGYLIALQIQCYDFVYSKISTFDIDRTTRTITSESLDCVPRMGEIVVTVIADRTPPYTTPGPET